jgi:hypothetical protein
MDVECWGEKHVLIIDLVAMLYTVRPKKYRNKSSYYESLY